MGRPAGLFRFPWSTQRVNNLSLSTAIAISGLCSLLVSAFYLALATTRQSTSSTASYVLLAFSYACYALRLGCQVLSDAGYEWSDVLDDIFYASWAAAFWMGVVTYRKSGPISKTIFFAPGLLVLWAAVARIADVSFLARLIPLHLGGAACFFLSSLRISRASGDRKSPVFLALATMMALQGLSTASYPFTRLTWYAPYGFSIFVLLALAIGMGLMVTALIEEQQELRSEVRARELAERMVVQREREFRSLAEHSPDSIMRFDRMGRYVYASPAIERVSGLPPGAYIGRRVGDTRLELGLIEDDSTVRPLRQAIDRAFQQNAPQVVELVFPRHRHAGRVFDVRLVPEPDGAGSVASVLGIAREITDGKNTEIALRRLNRSLRTLSRGNEILIRATKERELLNDMCRLLVEEGGYRMAWIGLQSDPMGTLNVAAWAGEEAGFLTTPKDPAGSGDPSVEAVVLGQVQLIHDIEADCPDGLFRNEALARGYRSVVAIPLSAGAQQLGALSLYSAELAIFDHAEMNLLVELANDLAYGINALRTRLDQEKSVERIQAAMEDTIQALASIVELRDPYTAGHQRRVGQLAAALGRRLGESEEGVRGLYLGGVVHDIGKIYVPAEILSRPGRLSKAEYDLVKTHVKAGADILQPIDFAWPIAPMVQQHHERMDGSGYPDGLASHEILWEARILAVADVVEAMSTHRPYRAALGIEAALAEIVQGAGRLYDQQVVDACVAVFREDGFRFL